MGPRAISSASYPAARAHTLSALKSTQSHGKGLPRSERYRICI